MLQVARQAPRLLSEGTELVRSFAVGQFSPLGGFVDRAGDLDLYYSVFGLGCLLALDVPAPVAAMRPWLERFGDGDGLDLIHLCALARCWRALELRAPAALLDRVAAYRAARGGYSVQRGAALGSPYGNFMALGAFQDLDAEPPRAEELIEGCLACATRDGGFANDPGLPIGNVPAFAATESVLRNLGAPLLPERAAWLKARAYPEGGFFAVPEAPMPDLLSTATALHALSGMDQDISLYREPCLDYLDSLWVNTGGFYGNWGDPLLDTEYTFYGLLALGHLSM